MGCKKPRFLGFFYEKPKKPQLSSNFRFISFFKKNL